MLLEVLVFKGEDESVGEVFFVLDLIVVVFLCVLGFFFGWMLVLLLVFGKVFSVFGLLLFLMFVSLVLMFVLFGLLVWKRWYS